MSKVERAAISKLVKEMAVICSIYDVDLRDLLEEHELAEGKDLDEKGDLVLADPP